MSYLNSSQIKTIIDKLGSEYDNLIETRGRLETDCSKLREMIENQITQIQSINNDFEKLRTDYQQHVQNKTNTGYVAESNAIPKEEESTENWQVKQINPSQEIDNPVTISLLAEIVDISVICSTAFSPNNTCLAIGSNRTLRIYNIQEDDFVLQYTISDGNTSEANHIRSLTWTPDSKYVICGGEDHYIRVFEIENKSLLATIEAGIGEVFQIQCAHKENYFATVTGDGALSLWKQDKYTKLWSSKRPGKDVVATSLSISDDDKTIAVGFQDNSLVFWDVESQSIIYQHECHSSGIYATQYLPGNKRIITSGLDSDINIWDVEKNGKEISMKLWKKLEGHTSYVLTLSIDATGKWLLSGSKDLKVILSSLEKGEMYYSIEAHTNTIITVSFNQSGNMFCTGSGDKSVKIWSLAVEQPVQE